MADAKKCGHINRHSIGLDRKLDNLECDLPQGHEGNHQGNHKEYQKTEDVKIVNGEETITIRYKEVEVRRGWTDMAGTPVSEIPVPDPVKQPTLQDLEDRMKVLEEGGKLDKRKTLLGST